MLLKAKSLNERNCSHYDDYSHVCLLQIWGLTAYVFGISLFKQFYNFCRTEQKLLKISSSHLSYLLFIITTATKITPQFSGLQQYLLFLTIFRILIFLRDVWLIFSISFIYNATKRL